MRQIYIRKCSPSFVQVYPCSVVSMTETNLSCLFIEIITICPLNYQLVERKCNLFFFMASVFPVLPDSCQCESSVVSVYAQKLDTHWSLYQCVSRNEILLAVSSWCIASLVPVAYFSCQCNVSVCPEYNQSISVYCQKAVL